MAINPMQLLKLKERLDIFRSQHPKVRPFFHAVRNTVSEGAVMELKVTSPEGKSLVTNIRLTPEDMETLEILRELRA